MKKEFTICIVNFFSSVYICNQLKILYEFNDPDLFQFVLVDNSKDEKEFQRLIEIVKEYKKFNNITLIKSDYYSGLNSSKQHSMGADMGLGIAKIIKSNYFVLLDADCFFLKKDILVFLKNLIRQKNLVVFGTPWGLKRQAKIQNYKDFPSPFAIIINLEKIGYGLSFSPSDLIEEISDLGRDTGYMLREKFAHMGYGTMDQTKVDNNKIFLNISFLRILPMEPDFFYYQNELIAVHIGKSSRSSKEVSGGWFLKRILNRYKWHVVRRNISDACYQAVRRN